MASCTQRSHQVNDSPIRNSECHIGNEEKENGSNVDALSMEQDGPGNDEAGDEGDDTSDGLAGECF